jgi:hypothetical protein
MPQGKPENLIRNYKQDKFCKGYGWVIRLRPEEGVTENQENP